MTRATLKLTSITTVRHAKEGINPIQAPREDNISNWRERHWLISNVDYGEDCADFKTREQYRQKMELLFGDTRLPAVVYKSETIPARLL